MMQGESVCLVKKVFEVFIGNGFLFAGFGFRFENFDPATENFDGKMRFLSFIIIHMPCNCCAKSIEICRKMLYSPIATS
jgi:hypothetical protein